MTRLSLDIGNYTDDDVTQALSTSGRTVRFTYEHLDSNLNSLSYLSGVVSCSVSYDSTQQIRRLASFTINEGLGDQINYMNDLIRPYMGVQMDDGGWCDIPLGVFMLSTSDRTSQDGTVTRDIDGYDLTQLLVQDKVEHRYLVAKGTLYTDAIAALLSGVGPYFISDSSSTLGADRTWPPGTSKLTIVSNLIKGIGFRPLFFDAWGTAQVLPFVAPSDDTSGWTYATDDASLIGPQATQTIDLFDIPNVFVRVIDVSNKTLLTSTFVNSNPDSPTSTVNRGRRIVDWAEANDASDQAALDAVARKAAVDASQVYETVSLPTVLMPFHQDRDIVTVQHDGLGVSEDFLETSWSMDLKIDGTMTHGLRSVVTVDAVGDAS